MPKRIQLPSADDIFELPGAVSGAPEPKPEAAAKPKPRTKPKSRARKASPRLESTAPVATVSHLDRVESSLRDLPIDTLIDLRDGLEDLLISERVDAEDLEQLLTSIGV